MLARANCRTFSGSFAKRPSIALGHRLVHIRASRRPAQNDILRLKDEEKEVAASIKQVESYINSLRSYIKKREERKARREIIESEKIDTRSPASDGEIEEIAQFMESEEDVDKPKQITSPDIARSLFSQNIDIPPELRDRMNASLIPLISQQPNWKALVSSIRENPLQLTGISIDSIDKLITMIPVQERAQPVSLIYEMVSDAGIKPSKLTLDLVMAAYAHKGWTVVVQAFRTEMEKLGYKPDQFTFGHLIKAYFKKGDLKTCAALVRQMKNEYGIVYPSIPVTTTLLQACIKSGDFKQAEEIFSMMKFISQDSQPGIRAYNAMLLGAAKSYNVERVLDLYKEMTTRPVDPLKPDMETYLTLIYACARDPRTHLRAWELVLELQDLKFPATRKLINMILYLCGNTGELAIARALFRKMCTNPSSYPDSHAFNSLIKSYSNFRPGHFSTVLTTAMSRRLQTSFVFEEFDIDKSSVDMDEMPPFIGKPMLGSKLEALAESRALFTFFKEKHPEMLNHNVVVSYMRVAMDLGDLKEFMARYEQETYPVQPRAKTNKVSRKSSPVPIPRDHYVYDLAIKACARLPKSLEFATNVWIERGKWRKTPSFANMTPQQRSNSDFLFARGMIDALVFNDEPQEAIDVLQSCIKQFPWKHAHVKSLIGHLQKVDDFNNLSFVRGVIHRKWAQMSSDSAEYIKYQASKDLRKLESR